ncbi:MAG: ATP-dependent DNA helicase [Burkholderiaceae bacterium]|nr:ATP-dependent DNA helicase [Burkholderiaceae bacterium]
MAQCVAEAIAGCSTLVAEAGTGTGKTFAYLVPLLMSGARAIISTGTRNLQDQLYRRDLPAVASALGLNPRFAVLKGRSNYICHHHLQRSLQDGRFERAKDAAALQRIARFAAVSSSGDRADALGIAETSPAWSRAVSTRENCLGQDCDDYERCFLTQARRRAMQADVVVVNHHLFCADLALRDDGVSELLPNTEAIVFDEAHQLPEIATQFFGLSFSTRQVMDLGRDLLRTGMADAADATDWVALQRGLEQAVRDWRLQAGPSGRIDAARARRLTSFSAALTTVRAQLGSAAEVLTEASERSRDLERLALRVGELVRRLDRWVAGLHGITSEQDGRAGHATGQLAVETAGPAAQATAMAPRSDPSMPDEPPVTDAVHWVDVHAQGVTLHATPLSVAGPFSRHRLGARRAWVFASATLTVDGRFDHFSRRLGLEDAQMRSWPSPFDYEAQSMLYVPAGLAEPSHSGFAAAFANELAALIVENRGRAFVLCTSLRMVDQMARLLEPTLGAASGYELLVQGTMPRAALLEHFRSAKRPVLVGSASFWEGVDVVGAQLSLVAIDKLPFAPPDDPVLRARADAAKRGGVDPFSTIQLPEAAMTLKQGVGRLIRAETDHGLLVIGDRRLVEKPYGRVILRSLPPFTLTRERATALEFVRARTAAS